MSAGPAARWDQAMRQKAAADNPPYGPDRDRPTTAQAACLLFALCSVRDGTLDPVSRADLQTSVADARSAVCLAAGMDPADITPLGYRRAEARRWRP